MNLLNFLNPVKSKAPIQVVSTSWGDRSRIVESGVNLFCWKRRHLEHISKYLESLSSCEMEDIKIPVDLEKVSTAVDDARKIWEAGRNNLESGNEFWEDVTRLTRDFLSFSDTNSGTMHLKVVTDDACTKFHVDGYSLRLFTTYQGKGTEWLPERATNRKRLGKSNRMIVRKPSEVQRMETFEVGILKGEVPGSSSGGRGIVHRSPGITKTGEKRIILRIDI